MGKILYRVFAHQLKKELSNLLNKEVDVVLANNSVLHGVILKTSETELVLRNSVRNKTVIALSEIQEILFTS